MNNNKLIIAVAGSGKTTYLIERACEVVEKTVLITTYTEANEAEIKQKIISKKGYIPSNITIQTWFSFLLQHGVRPYQSLLNDGIHDKYIGFYLISEKSGWKTDTKGNPICNSKGHRIYWGEKDFKKYYFTNNFKIYSDKISKFVFTCNKVSNNEVMSRITRIFDYIFIDEVQDLAGYDLELIKLFFKSDSPVLIVGDPRQVTYLTHHTTKFGKYSDGQIKRFVENELGKSMKCDIDESTLRSSHRNNQAICDYSAKLYPLLPNPEACKCEECRKIESDHEGVFLVRPTDVDNYLTTYNPTQLRWSVKVKTNTEYASRNFGESKGATFERVLIYPTKEMEKWIKNNTHRLKNETRSKLYVGITRARRSTAIVMEFDIDDTFEGIVKYYINEPRC